MVVELTTTRVVPSCSRVVPPYLSNTTESPTANPGIGTPSARMIPVDFSGAVDSDRSREPMQSSAGVLSRSTLSPSGIIVLSGVTIPIIAE